MRYSIIFVLINRLFKVYISNTSNRNVEYKKVLFYTLEEYGGVYVKFLQVLSLMNKFMDGWATPREYDVFNRVREEYIDLNQWIKNKNDFKEIYTKPIAAGSFAQVYKGVLNDGTVVAIKILRPSVYKSLKKDLKSLKKIVKIASKFISIDIVDLNQAYDEFSSMCLKETNYLNEMSNMKYFYNRYSNHKYIVIPKLYENLSSRLVIVEEFIFGVSFADLLSRKVNYAKLKNESNFDLFKQLTILGGEILNMAITADFVYGDPHPGNIIFLPNNRIALIDFGIITAKPVSQEAFYFWMKSYYSILNNNPDYEDFFRYTLMCFCPNMINAISKFDLDHILMSIVRLLENRLEGVVYQDEVALNYLNNGHLFKIFSEYLNVEGILNFEIDMRNFKLIKAMQSFLGSITTLSDQFCDLDFLSLMIGSIQYSLNYVEKVGINQDYSYNTKYNLGEFYEILLDLFTSLANKDQLLFNRLVERM